MKSLFKKFTAFVFAVVIVMTSFTPVQAGCPKGGKMGNYGRLYITGCDIAVPLYKAKWDAGYNQSVVDRGNSALFMTADQCSGYSDSDWVADHCNQGFSRISRAKPGKTIAYIRTKSGKVYKYKCYKNFKGRNTGSEIRYSNGSKIPRVKNGLGMYTCVNGWRNVRVVLWKRV